MKCIPRIGYSLISPSGTVQLQRPRRGLYPASMTATGLTQPRGRGEGATTPESTAARSALVAVLIYARPLCIGCMAEKAGIGHAEVQSYLESIEQTIEVNRGVDRCRSCGQSTTTYSLVRTD